MAIIQLYTDMYYVKINNIKGMLKLTVREMTMIIFKNILMKSIGNSIHGTEIRNS